MGSLADLERETGEALPAFAYPAGGYDDTAVEVLAEAGVELAFTTDPGVSDVQRDDPLRLRRISVGPRTTTALLRAQLALNDVVSR